MLSRRSLLGLSGSLMAGAMLRPLLAATPSPQTPAFSLFTKHLVGLPYDQLAETVAELGFKGVEAPVRKGGHVEPRASKKTCRSSPRPSRNAAWRSR